MNFMYYSEICTFFIMFMRFIFKYTAPAHIFTAEEHFVVDCTLVSLSITWWKCGWFQFFGVADSAVRSVLTRVQVCVWSTCTSGLESLLPGRGIFSQIMSDYFQSSCVARSAYSRSDVRRKLMMSLHKFAILKMTSWLRGCRSALDV